MCSRKSPGSVWSFQSHLRYPSGQASPPAAKECGRWADGLMEHVFEGKRTDRVSGSYGISYIKNIKGGSP
jgi:hypothetical protein